MKRIFISIMAAAAVLASCDTKEVETRKGEGTFMLQSLTADTNLNDIQVGTKALPNELNNNQFIAAMELTIKNTQDANLKQTFNYLDIVNKPVQLATGSYTVSAVSVGGKDAAWDQPLFAGSTNFEVKPNTVSPVEIKCALTNAVVSINCSDTFTTEVSDYNIKVSDAKGNFLTWTRENIGNDGYFTAKELNVTIEGKRSLDGNSTATVTGTIKNIQPKDHIILNIDAKVTGQVQQIVVTVNGKVNDRNENIFVDGFEEIEIPDPSQPDQTPDQPETPAAPTIEWPDNKTFATTELAETMKIDLIVKAPGKIKTFLVVVDSPSLENTLPSMTGIEGKEGCTLDLINNITLINNFKELGLGLPTGAELEGQTEVAFPLSSLVPMIYQIEVENKSKNDSDHKFTLKLSDEAGQELSQTLVFHYTAKTDSK